MTDEAKPETRPKRKETRHTEDWVHDQEERGYYYDDAHGYETYDPDEDEEGSDDEEGTSA